jgi:predicted PurR-regulated permease PerM
VATVREPRPAPRGPVAITFYLVLAVALGITLRILAPFFAVILLSLAAAGLVHPGYRRLTLVLGGRQRMAALLVCALLVAAVLVPMFLTGQAVSREALGFYDMTTQQLADRSLLDLLQERRDVLDRLNRLTEAFGLVLTPQRVYDSLASTGVRLGAFFYRQGVSIAKGLIRLFFGVFFWLLVLYYLLVDGDRVLEWFLDVVPLPAEQQAVVRRRFTEMAGSLVIGNGLAGVVQGVVGGMMFAMLGLPGPVLWGVVMGILAFIPVVGISLIYLPAAAILLIAGETSKAMVLLVVLAAVATMVEYIAKPALVGRRAHLHPLLVFLSLLGGIDAFGAVGLVVGPLMMTGFVTLVGIYRESYRVRPPITLS